MPYQKPREFDETNRFTLRRNDRATKPTDAKYTGTLDVGGKKFWINAWGPSDRQKEAGIVLSGSIKEKEEAPQRRQAYQRPKPDDEIL